MKIRVAIPGVTIALDMEEGRARSIFQDIVQRLLVQGLENSAVACGPGLEDQNVIQTIEKDSAGGFGGFLYLKCPKCGKIKGFCSKTRINHFRCECGEVTELKHLVPLYMHCECGRRSRYLTNMDEKQFDMICYDCGAPVAIGWNENKKQFETM